ncbi:MAG: hypothetical protein FJW35_14735 [Acidobacteria bacterium]|nr:hypothetical protein [Acidobacteriota bacterium]
MLKRGQFRLPRPGDADATLDWLERGVEERDGGATYLGFPMLDLVRATPRFQALMRMMNLPVAPPAGAAGVPGAPP